MIYDKRVRICLATILSEMEESKMETELVWQDRFNIGVEHIDKEHKKIFSVINKLLMSNAQADKRAINCQESIKYFKDHALKHFTEEEAYMASINYKGFETHRHLHDGFRKKILPELEKELGKTNYSANSVSHFLGVCTGLGIPLRKILPLPEMLPVNGKACCLMMNKEDYLKQLSIYYTICSVWNHG